MFRPVSAHTHAFGLSFVYKTCEKQAKKTGLAPGLLEMEER
jgi:hypothetical protein